MNETANQIESVIETDVVIIGAGPCGLFQVFELGLLGLNAQVVDSITQPGGQCAELYPDKPIYDIPAVPVCTGLELTENLLKQIKPFGAGLHLGHEVTELQPQEDGTFHLRTHLDQEFHAKAVVIAGGVGSFQPRRIRVADADEYEGTSLHYRVRNPEQFAGQRLLICGGGDSALDWALELADKVAHLTFVHRRDEYRAVDASVAKLRELAAAGTVDLLELSTVDSLQGSAGRLEKVRIKRADDSIDEVHVDHMMVFFGLAPKLGPIADWGLELERKTLPVDTEKFETSISGVYAVGDINTYPGKKKLILSGFHEGALAAFAIKQRIEPNKKVRVQYTTTSPLMHERLGLSEDD
ncbi:MAG: NAD(P)/FAD-dependent oxidoreductase [Gammaproteobacteria bacterium]